ncbi:hypothetical protein GEOBRER4_n2529 [Citrifermentans bremense]|uniref:SsuA/THI5-like domain-containing protein n=1 Tax=Citrifermentans bremense TaxID=60035 RepID=A0A6S6M048_9BACT|nr:ABC transporter substrate-binding protein [Citrifermentans bremense]BCG47687.1 hypothetical protein GEOBRER4_n2529 [Citrifermentans bremense]
MRPFALASIVAVLLAICLAARPGIAEAASPVRFGYLDQPGSALFLLADAASLFKREGVDVVPVRFADSASGLAALGKGKLDAGCFAADQALQAIARGAAIRIIAGGGTDHSASVLDEVDASARLEREGSGILVAAAEGAGAPDRETLGKVVTALIKAHVLLQNNPADAWGRIPHRRPGKGEEFRFDPDPDYWRLAQIWKRLDLQQPAMPRGFLADHVYDEIYCDALGDLNDGEGEPDPVLKQLAGKAVCPPDCCPTGKKKRTDKGGTP